MKKYILFIILIIAFCHSLSFAGGGKGDSVPQHFLDHEVQISKLTAELVAAREFVGYLKLAIGVLATVISALWLWARSITKEKDAILNARFDEAKRIINLSKGDGNA